MHGTGARMGRSLLAWGGWRGSRPASPPVSQPWLGKEQSHRSSLPSPSTTINTSWLGKRGRGRVFIAQPALAPSEAARATHAKSTRAITERPLAPAGTEPRASRTGTGRNFGAHHSSFHAAPSPRSTGGRKRVPSRCHTGACSRDTCPDALHLFPKSVQQAENRAGKKSRVQGRWSPEGPLGKPSGRPGFRHKLQRRQTGGGGGKPLRTIPLPTNCKEIISPTHP